jgi:hypothetical protein
MKDSEKRHHFNNLFSILGTFTVKLPKLHQDEYFEGLDMLTSLLTPRKKPKINQPSIEVINGKTLIFSHLFQVISLQHT